MKHLAREIIIKHEGFRARPYRDSVGKLTIGFGRNIEDFGISWAEALFMLDNDLTRVEEELKSVFKDDWKELPVNIKVVLMDMCYNLGLPRFLTFRRMIKAVRDRDWAKMIVEMLDSRWARQVPNRARDLAKMVEVVIDGERADRSNREGSKESP